MTCRVMGNTIMCGPGVGRTHKPCSWCGAEAKYLCDWPMANGKTCDLPLCSRCSVPDPHDPNKDFCRIHVHCDEGKFR
jgi:hypothetical protein